MESYAHLLDYLPNGRQTERGFHREPLALGIGETELKLFELVPGRGRPSRPANGSRCSRSRGPRRRSTTSGAASATTSSRSPGAPSFPGRSSGSSGGHPERFLRFFNEAPAVSRRFHLLELLPGIGKKTMQQIVDERKRAPFSSFDEMEQRLHLKSPELLIVGRIEEELRGVPDKYRLFVAP
ncbi:protein containing DUF655 [mine drainage metagenome]|uniref:Protein containing DUF655 n=1 Tax=mine drainage metagenome TaxID=410659 RepID=T1CKM2_9ZZZZ